MTDQIIATLGFIGIVFGFMAALRIALRASLVARLLIEELFAAQRQVALPILSEAIERANVHERQTIVDPQAFDLQLAA